MAVMTAEPIKSEQDHKLYKRLKLDNGLDVLLIHDPEMEASSSADDDAHMATDADSDGHGDAGSSLQVRPYTDKACFTNEPCNWHMPPDLQLSSAQGDSEEDSESMAGDEDDRQHVKKVLSFGIVQIKCLPMSALPPAVLLSTCVGDCRLLPPWLLAWGASAILKMCR